MGVYVCPKCSVRHQSDQEWDDQFMLCPECDRVSKAFAFTVFAGSSDKPGKCLGTLEFTEPAFVDHPPSQEKYRVWIRWGQTERTAPQLHEFDTQEELDAFLLGVDEGCGWLDYEQFDSEEQALGSACLECNRVIGAAHDPSCGQRIAGILNVTPGDCYQPEDSDEEGDDDE
jgi:hypothetical protein